MATLTPQPPGSAAAQPSATYAIERATLGATLNFVVAANLMSGMVRMTARVWRAGDATKSLIDTYQETVDVTVLQTLSLRGIFIAYNGPDPHEATKNTAPPGAKIPVVRFQITLGIALGAITRSRFQSTLSYQENN